MCYWRTNYNTFRKIRQEFPQQGRSLVKYQPDQKIHHNPLKSIMVKAGGILPSVLIFSLLTIYTTVFGYDAHEGSNNITQLTAPHHGVQLKSASSTFSDFMGLFIDPPQVLCYYDTEGFFCNIEVGKKTRRMYITTQSSHVWVFDEAAQKSVNKAQNPVPPFTHNYYDKKARSRDYKDYAKDVDVKFTYIDGSSYSGRHVAKERIRVGRNWNDKALVAFVDNVAKGSRVTMDGVLGLGTHATYLSGHKEKNYQIPEFVRIAKKTGLGGTLFSVYLNPRPFTETEERKKITKAVSDGGKLDPEDVAGRLRFGSELPVECYEEESLIYMPIVSKYPGWVVKAAINLEMSFNSKQSLVLGGEGKVDVEMDFGSRNLLVPRSYYNDFINMIPEKGKGVQWFVTPTGHNYAVLKNSETCTNMDTLLPMLKFSFAGADKDDNEKTIDIVLNPSDYISKHKLQFFGEEVNHWMNSEAEHCVIQMRSTAPPPEEAKAPAEASPTPTVSLGRPFFLKAFSTYVWNQNTGKVGLAHSKVYSKSPSYPWPAATAPSYAGPKTNTKVDHHNSNNQQQHQK